MTTTTTRPCDYCFTEIPAQALRCATCAGEFRYCRRCDKNVGVSSKQKFVGLVRGGMKEQFRCLHCGLVVDGPRW